LTLRVAVDAVCLSGPGGFRGNGTYLRSILGHLGADPGLDVVALATRGTVLPDGIGAETVVRRAPSRWAAREHALRLPLDLRRVRADVAWEPTPDPPRSYDGPWVQTLLDVAPLVRNDADLAPERARWRQFAARYRAADAVIAISRYSADEGIRVLGLDPRRVHVCHLGASPQFRPGAGPADPPYLVMVNEFGLRKGYPEAFAVAGAIADQGFPHTLKVGGRIAPWVRHQVEEMRAASPHPERVELLGFVDDLVGLYQGASAFVGTSRYEGFGLPALEAMACGIPVNAFANTATTEVVGEGGVLIDDGDVEAMAGAVRRVLADAAWRLELAQRAVARAATFSWDKAAATHAEILRAVAQATP
jgi:alpha-1,3-rhamnosyl/mannosyltransferase